LQKRFIIGYFPREELRFPRKGWGVNLAGIGGTNPFIFNFIWGLFKGFWEGPKFIIIRKTFLIGSKG